MPKTLEKPKVQAKTRSQLVADDVAALLRARNPLIWVVAREESRVERYLFAAAEAANYLPRTWDIAQGVCSMDGSQEREFQATIENPDAALDAIREREGERGLWVMRDLPVWLGSGLQGAVTLRRLRNLARWLPSQPRSNAQSIVVLSPVGDVPSELANHATVIEWPLPDRAEIGAMLDVSVKPILDSDQVSDEVKASVKASLQNGARAAAVDAAVGLSGDEIQATFARSLVQLKAIDPAAIAKEKKRVIARERVLEWVEPLSDGLDAVGGLDNLKTWLKSRAAAYSPKARDYGLPSPKGALLVGVPGCGKTMSAKAVPTAWNVPCLRLDMGALKSKFVGESEGNLRKAFSVIEALGRCVVWVDEIEKALEGATSGSADGGVSADALGALLSWMQERRGEAFVIATANNAEKLPPELMRKGRFDEIWWVDLPNHGEREAITAATLRSFKRDATELGIDLSAVADATEDFSGAEVAAIVPDALYHAFAEDEREITTDDLVEAASVVVPLARTAGEKIEAMRKFWIGRARPATAGAIAEKKGKATEGRQIDL